MAALRYRQPVSDAISVAWCESRLDPSANNEHGDLGLYQFAEGTYLATDVGRRHPAGIFIARWSALAAMELWSHGGKDQWECQ